MGCLFSKPKHHLLTKKIEYRQPLDMYVDIDDQTKYNNPIHDGKQTAYIVYV